jgi:hypothetical protein
VVGPEAQPQQVRDDQPDEADQARDRYRGAHHQRGREQQHALEPRCVDPELRRRLLPEREQIEVAQQRQRAAEAERKKSAYYRRCVGAHRGEAADQPQKQARALGEPRE